MGSRDGIVSAAMISDGDFNVVEDLISVWRNDELLNALGWVVDKDVDSVPVLFDVSADGQLIELQLAWRVDCDRRDAVRDRESSGGRARRSAENAHTTTAATVSRAVVLCLGERLASCPRCRPACHFED